MTPKRRKASFKVESLVATLPALYFISQGSREYNCYLSRTCSWHLTLMMHTGFSLWVVGLRRLVTLCKTAPYRNSLTYLLTYGSTQFNTWQSNESKHPASWIVSVRVCQEAFIRNRKLIIVVTVVNVISNLSIMFCTSNHSIKTTERKIKTNTLLSCQLRCCQDQNQNSIARSTVVLQCLSAKRFLWSKSNSDSP